MLKNEAFKKYSANFAFLVGNVYSRVSLIHALPMS